MSWCSKCKAEYIDGVTRCGDCDVELIDEKSETEEDIVNKPVDWALLKNFSESETYVIETLLKEEGIPVLKRRRGVGGYLKVSAGMSIFGVDIYVPSEELNRAKELLEKK